MVDELAGAVRCTRGCVESLVVVMVHELRWWEERLIPKAAALLCCAAAANTHRCLVTYLHSPA